MTATEHTILIVDDEETIHRALKRTLRRQPYRLLHAFDAAEAWAILQQHPEVAGIICDHYMPGTRGLDLLTEVRCRHPGIVTILLTAQADLQLVIHAINEGHIHQFVTKPWSAEDLRTRLQDLLEQGASDAASVQRAADVEERLEEDLLPAQDEATGAFIIVDPTAS